MPRPASEGTRPRRGVAGQATVEWIGLAVGVALLVMAVGVAIRVGVPGRVVEALRSTLATPARVAPAPQASERTLAFARSSVAAGTGSRPSLLGARALLRAELGARAGTRVFEEVVLGRLATDTPAWFGEQVVPVRGTAVRGIHLGGGVRTTTATGPVVLHVVTPAEEQDVVTGGRGAALRGWVTKLLEDQAMKSLGDAVEDDLKRGGAGRLPIDVVGVAPTVIGALPILFAEADEGWPSFGETAGDAILCRPVSVRTVRGAGRATTVRPGVRLAVVRDGAFVVDAVSTAERSCAPLPRPPS